MRSRQIKEVEGARESVMREEMKMVFSRRFDPERSFKVIAC